VWPGEEAAVTALSPSTAAVLPNRTYLSGAMNNNAVQLTHQQNKIHNNKQTIFLFA
jgi:hypothetical protein